MKHRLTLLLVFLSAAAFGQEKISSEINYNSSSVKYNDTAAHVRQEDFKIAMPLYKGTNGRLSGNVSYTDENFGNFPEAFGSNVQGVSIGLNWNEILNERHVLSLFGDVGVYSDMNSLSSKDFRERVGLSYLTKYSDSFALGFGVAYARQFYGNQILPIIIIRYHFDNEHWKLSGLFPLNPKLTYQINEKNAFSLETNHVYSSFQLNGTSDAGRFVETNKLTGMVNYEFFFSKSWRLSTGIGYAIRQKYDLYNYDHSSQWYFLGSAIGSKPIPIESISNKGVQWHIGLAFNPPF